MEEQQRREMGERLSQLRERSPWTQDDMADKLGYKTTRGYQKLEERGTTKFELCERLFDIHAEWTQRSDDWQHVSAEWIWDGTMPKETPDVMGELSRADQQRLIRIEKQQEEILKLLREERAPISDGGEEDLPARVSELAAAADEEPKPASERAKPSRRKRAKRRAAS